MSGPEDQEKRARGAGRSGSPGSIGQELGGDLDFEADALLDSLLSDEAAAPARDDQATTARPSAPEAETLEAVDAVELQGSEAPPSARVLHAPQRREFPDDEVTWVGNVEEVLRLGVDLAPSPPPAPVGMLPPPGAAQPPPVVVPLAPPPVLTGPRPAGIPRPGGSSNVPRPGAAPRPSATTLVGGIEPPSKTGARPFEPEQPAQGYATPIPQKRELPLFNSEEEEVTRVHSMPTLHDIDGLLERAARTVPPATGTATIRAQPMLGDEQARALDPGASALDELLLDDDAEIRRPSASPSAIDNLSELSFEDAPDPELDDLLSFAPASEPPGGAPPPEDELEALADAELEELDVNDPSRAPLSHTPPPPELRSPTSLWPDERPAAAHVALDAESWTKRAEWLEAEAHGASDPLAKARTLLVASEIWALTGDTSRAREVATEASSMARSLTLVGRQLRALAATEQDWKAVATALELETRGAPSVEARVHAAYLNAEVHRLPLGDEATAKKKLELAVRASVDDPRAHVAKLLEQMSKGTGPARMRWPESVNLGEIMQATEESSRLRGAPSPAGAPGVTVSPSLALEQAKKALASGDRAQAATLVARLAEIEGVGASALWLAAGLAAHEEKTRPEAIGWLERLLGGGADAMARRSLAARAIEQGSAEGVRAASDGESEAFGALERAVLGAVSGEGLETLGSLVTELGQSESQRPLAAAIHGALAADGQAELLAGTDASRSAQALGLALAPSDGAASARGLLWLRTSARRFAQASPDHPLSAALELSFASADRVAEGVVRGVTALADHDPERTRDAAMISAMAEELTGDRQAAATRYGAVLEADPRSPTALRALLQNADRDSTIKLLTSAAEASGDPAQAALYWLEAALRIGPEDAERYDELLRRAAEALPSLALIHRLGEQHARSRGDTEKLLGWLRARRAEADDPVETALDLVREALLIAESDMPAAASLLSDALAARATDVALRELHERIAGSTDEQRAAWREQAAESADPATSRELLSQAALEHHRAGNAEAAAHAAYAAVALGAGDLVRVLGDESAVGTTGSARLSEALLAEARSAEAPAELCELYERLSKLDRARGDTSSALLWQTAILERLPDHLPALRRVEHQYIGSNRLEELEPIATRLAALTTGSEGDAHARLAARIRIRTGAWPEVRPLVAGALEQEPARLWALRMLEAQSRVADDPQTLLAVTQRLQDRVERPVDKATLLLRAGEAAGRLGKLEQAQILLERALSQVPEHQVVLTTLAEVLESRGDYRASARALESLAQVSNVDSHKVSAWHQAAVLWLDKAGETERGRAALEQAVALDVRNEDAVVRLQTLYVSGGEREKLARLLERRLSHTSDPEERVALEVTRGRALADVGDRVQAKAALSAALDANPDHVEALEAFAELCGQEGDWAAAEQAFIRLVRHVPEPARQAQIYRRLGELYDTALPNVDRAELAYREVLRRDPEDAEAVSRLVQVLARRGSPDKAVELQSEFLARAPSPATKRERTLALAFVIEQVAGDRKKAEALLDKARKEAPLDPLVLRALVELHQRAGEQRASTVLLERAASDARRALATGRFDPALFEMLAQVAELRGAHDAASLATATLLALSGEDLSVTSTGQAAGDIRLDDQLAPDLISPALRSLLKKSGDVLDAAFPVDLRALKAAPLPAASAAFVSFVQNVAQSFGLRGLEVMASPALGAVCLPVSSSPPRLVFGQSLLDQQDDAARFFLLMRCLKILQGRAAALSRMPPIELPAIMSAFLSLFAPNWAPPGVDGKKLADARARLEQAMRVGLDDDVPVLALEVIGSLGSRMSQLGTAIHQWGNRAGLLAVGSPNAALRALSFIAGQLAGPPPGPERVKWVIRNPEARDLAVFSVSEAYAEARARLGVAH